MCRKKQEPHGLGARASPKHMWCADMEPEFYLYDEFVDSAWHYSLVFKSWLGFAAS